MFGLSLFQRLVEKKKMYLNLFLFPDGNDASSQVLTESEMLLFVLHSH